MQFTPVTGNTKTRTPLADIPADVQTDLEEVYTWSIADGNTESRLATEPFETREDAEDYLSLARSWGYQRPAGRVVVTGNTAKGVPTGFVARFRIDTYVKPADDTGEDAPTAT